MNIGMQEHVIVSFELHRCLTARRLTLIVALAIGGVFLVVQRGSPPPLMSTVFVALSALEPQFNAMFGRTRRELEAWTLFPLSWRRVILIKNLTTVAASLLVCLLMAMTILYFSPSFPGVTDLADSALYYWTLIGPLLITGNLRSVQERARPAMVPHDDLVQAFGMAILLSVYSVPYVICSVLLQSSSASLAYGALAAVCWWQVSLPRTAKRWASHAGWS